MKVHQQNYLRDRVYSMLGQHTKKQVLEHFMKEKIARSTIYSIMKRFEDGKPSSNLQKTGRPRILNQSKLEKLRKAAVDLKGASNRVLSRKFQVSKETVRQNLLKMEIKYHKKVTVPRYSEKQLLEIPKKCRILRRQIFTANRQIILDDEKYFTFSWNNSAQNAGFYTNNIQTTPDDVRFAPKGKFESKVLVWAAISSKGISQLYIQDSKAPAIKATTYISKCLSKLDKFIKEKHPNEDSIFWPDLASSHYAKITLDWLKEKNINFVPKHANPPNVPKARPIEDFWSLLCQQVYSKGWEAKTTDQLIARIKLCVKKVDLEAVQVMIGSIKSKLRQIEEKGPLSLYK